MYWRVGPILEKNIALAISIYKTNISNVKIKEYYHV